MISPSLQFLEGVGFNWEEEFPVYRLTHASPACTAEDFAFSVEGAVYQDGLLYLAFEIRLQAPVELYELSRERAGRSDGITGIGSS